MHTRVDGNSHGAQSQTVNQRERGTYYEKENCGSIDDNGNGSSGSCRLRRDR